MQTILDVLYDYATDRDDLTHWLHDQDIAELYTVSARLAAKQQAQLLSRLPPQDVTLFQNLIDNAKTASQLTSEMLFCQGLAMGLRLGSLTLRA